MIQVESRLKVADNSGARYIQCIRCLQGFNRVYAYIGNYIVASIKELRLIKKVKKGEIYLCLIIRTKKETKFLDGSSLKFGSNSAVLLNKKKRILGTRIFGWVPRNFRKKKFMRVLLLSTREQLV